MAISQLPKTTLPKTFRIILYRDKGIPMGFEIQTQKLIAWLSITLLILAGLCSGTLLLFRELEKNRLLTLELHSTQSQCTLHTASSCAGSNSPGSTPAAPPTLPVTGAPTGPFNPAATAATELPRVIQSIAASPKAATTPTLIPTISELSASCSTETCQAHFSMTAQGSGTASGKLLLVLETEVPRIGGAATSDSMTRKRYFFYPEQAPQDVLQTEALSNLKQNPYRFNRTLKTNATFTLGNFLRPLSINAYVFDENQTLLRHERKPIDENNEQAP